MRKRRIPLLEKELELRNKVSGEGHPRTVAAKANLGVNYRDAGRLEEALPLLEQAYDASKKDPNLGWIGGHLAVAYLEADRPEQAMAIFEESAKHSMNHGLALLGMGDSDGYKRVVDEMRIRLANGDKSGAVELAWITMLRPISENLQDIALKVAEPLGRPESPDHHELAAAATLFRCGKLTEAIERLEKLNRDWEDGTSKPTVYYSPAYLWYFLAMAHHEHGDDEQAREWFDRANEWVEEESAKGKPHVAWNRRLTYKLLRAEAEQMIERVTP